jgi:FRG domain
METIGSNSLWSLLNGAEGAESITCAQIRKDDGHLVHSYLELTKKVALLQFRNRDHVLLFRGQASDYKNAQKNTTIKPTILRSAISGKVPSDKNLRERFEILQECEERLADAYARYKFAGFSRLKRHQILRWSILQHYEICKTPLLDVTQSLRIAASFASVSSEQDDAFLMVLGVPNISGAVTASDEAGLQMVRLASACPPDALRPHIQEGFLLGEYPGLLGIAQMEHYRHYQTDFGRRLVAKFRFKPSKFWRRKSPFPQVAQSALYPNASDPVFELAETIRPTSPAE